MARNLHTFLNRWNDRDVKKTDSDIKKLSESVMEIRDSCLD